MVKSLRWAGLEEDADRGEGCVYVSLHVWCFSLKSFKATKRRVGNGCSKKMPKLEGIYFANSFNASVAFGAFSFWTSKTFLGGEGQCRDKRSLHGVSTHVSILLDLSVGLESSVAKLTLVAWVYAVR